MSTWLTDEDSPELYCVRTLSLMRPRCFLFFVVAVSAVATSATSWPALADESCRVLQYSFQPDCFVRNTAGACQFDRLHPDFGPQVAVWIEDTQHTVVDTLMVTNAVALYGIGNRPGR